MSRSTFHDNAVIITGASSGIGRALAVQLADQGARLSLAARTEDRLDRVAAECRERGARVLVAPTDVAEEDQCRALIEQAAAEFGRIDTLINNAGLGLFSKIDDLPDLSLLERVTQVNYLGSVYCTYHALPHLKRSRGRIVGVSSLLGRFAMPWSAAYCGSKHAMTGFFDALRMALKRHGVSVTMVYPGYVVTEFGENLLEANGEPAGERARAFSRQGMMTAETCARITLRAAARRRREVNMTLRGKLALLGRLAAPWILDWFMLRMARTRT